VQRVVEALVGEVLAALAAEEGESDQLGAEDDEERAEDGGEAEDEAGDGGGPEGQADARVCAGEAGVEGRDELEDELAEDEED